VIAAESWLDTAGDCSRRLFPVRNEPTRARIKDHIERMAALGLPRRVLAGRRQFTGCAPPPATPAAWCLIVFTAARHLRRRIMQTDAQLSRLMLLNNTGVLYSPAPRERALASAHQRRGRLSE
jgi:hypothetical protein